MDSGPKQVQLKELEASYSSLGLFGSMRRSFGAQYFKLKVVHVSHWSPILVILVKLANLSGYYFGIRVTYQTAEAT